METALLGPIKMSINTTTHDALLILAQKSSALQLVSNHHLEGPALQDAYVRAVSSLMGIPYYNHTLLTETLSTEVKDTDLEYKLDSCRLSAGEGWQISRACKSMMACQ